MASQKQNKINERIRKIVAEVIQAELHDPRLGFCTVTKAEVTQDCKFAKVFVSIMGPESKRRTTMKGLESSRIYIQQRIAKNLETRKIFKELHEL